MPRIGADVVGSPPSYETSLLKTSRNPTQILQSGHDLIDVIVISLFLIFPLQIQ